MIDYLLPALIGTVLLIALWKRKPVYNLFLKGAKDGAETAWRIFPNLAVMMCAVEVMKASGLMEGLARWLTPAFHWSGIPPETASLVLLRPVSGSASLAMLQNILTQYGPDSTIGLIACTLMGSSETIFYTISIYTSGLENKDTGYAVICSLLGAAAAALVAPHLF